MKVSELLLVKDFKFHLKFPMLEISDVYKEPKLIHNKILLILLLSLALGACGGKVSNAVNAIPANAASSSPTPAAKGQTVTIDAPDGVKLVGSFFEASKSNAPGLLLLHQWQSDRHSYDEFAKRMQAKGFSVLSIDGRGFGESTKKADGSAVAAGRTDADVKAMLGDVGAAVEFLKKQKNVDATKIGIVGASYGSSLALIYAADHPDIKAVGLLSPGLNYFGNMPTLPAVKKYGDRDLFMAAAAGDAESAKAVDDLKTGGPKEVILIVPGGTYHGTNLFQYVEKPATPPAVESSLDSFVTHAL
jgi:dienelactone hydrolase